ncbi:MAG: phosphorylated adapter RNA export RNA-binding domain-containing protein [Pseudomonadota bacterium]
MASDQTINTIAKALGEADEGPLAQIKAVVDNLGDQACLTLLAETEKIEKAGGLMRGDGSGRRSPGGVFFFLARQRLPRDVRAAIFNDKKPRDPNAPKSAPVVAKSAPAGAGAAAPPSSSAGLPRRRVFEVVPASKPAPVVVVNAPRHEPRGEWPPAPPEGSFIPPELPAAVVQAKARQGAQAALSPLNPTDQYLLLVGLLADLHAQFGGEVPRAIVAEVPRSERKPTNLSQPPASQPPAAIKRAVEEEEEVEEPKPRATPRAKAARPKATAAKSRSRA